MITYWIPPLFPEINEGDPREQAEVGWCLAKASDDEEKAGLERCILVLLAACLHEEEETRMVSLF